MLLLLCVHLNYGSWFFWLVMSYFCNQVNAFISLISACGIRTHFCHHFFLLFNQFLFAHQPFFSSAVSLLIYLDLSQNRDRLMVVTNSQLLALCVIRNFIFLVSSLTIFALTCLTQNGATSTKQDSDVGYVTVSKCDTKMHLEGLQS